MTPSPARGEGNSALIPHFPAPIPPPTRVLPPNPCFSSRGSGAPDNGGMSTIPAPPDRLTGDARRWAAAEPSPDDAVALPLHCFSPPECNAPDPTGGPPCHPGNAAGVIRDGTAPQPPGPGRRDATIRAAGSVTQAATLRPAQPSGCPGGAIMAPVRPGSPLRSGRDDKRGGSPSGTSPGSGRDDKDAGRSHGLARTDAVRLQLHCSSRPESNTGGPAP